ncbi:MAG: hypothetical protein HS100_21885 [Anaerolineales bacterium]|nr:hypothetical protein [Anaerolineales bacterium]
MKKRNPDIPLENLNVGYNSIVDYHNNLVQVRFTVAGLSVAADGFLASAFFQTDSPEFSRILISILGLILTFICGMLELRTLQLLMKLLKAGYTLEKTMGLGEDQGVFSVLTHSQVVPRFLKKFSKAPTDQESRFVFSHSVMFWLLYLCIFIFWAIMLILVFLKIV